MSPPPIYVDMDDVLCETARGFVSLLEREFGRRVSFDQIHDFDLGVSFGLDPVELERFFEIAHRPELLTDLDPLPGAIETVRVTPEDSPLGNYAFDVTPARLVTGLITERGVAEASAEGLGALYPERAAGDDG